MLVPHVGHQRLTGHGVACVSDEPGEQIELLRSQRELDTSDPHASRREVDRQITQLAAGEGPCLAAAKLSSDACQQFGELERLGDVVDRSGIESDDDVELLVAGGEHDDLDTWIVSMEPAAHLEPVDVGKSEVEQHEIGPVASRRFDRDPTTRLPPGVVSAAVEGAQQRRSDSIVVLDDEDSLSAHGVNGRASR